MTSTHMLKFCENAVLYFVDHHLIIHMVKEMVGWAFYFYFWTLDWYRVRRTTRQLQPGS